MKKEILIIKNSTSEGPGLLVEVLKEKNVECFTVDLERRENPPPVENFGAVVVLGGPDSANDANEKMKNELAFIRNAIDLKIPYLGICLGLQTLVKAAGAKVIKSPVKETGFIDPEGNNFTIELTEEGKKDPLFENLNSPLNVFHLHGETVELPDNIILLATGKFSRNQAVKIGSNAYGIQCHFELTPEMFEAWLNNDPDLRQLNKEQLRKVFYKIKDEYIKTGKQLFGNFLRVAGY